MKGRKIMTKRFGFTLAEVLITLGIIGVVAAMTIPTLMNSTNDAQFKTGLKKVVSTLSQAITMNVAVDNADFGALTSGTTNGSIYDMFTSRMNVAKTTTAADSSLDTGLNKMASASNYTLYFNDGMVIAFPTAAATCTTLTSANCDVVIDVNGAKGPNRLSNCASSTAGILTEPAATCTSANIKYYDRFSLKMVGQQILPNSPSTAFTMYN